MVSYKIIASKAHILPVHFWKNQIKCTSYLRRHLVCHFPITKCQILLAIVKKCEFLGNIICLVTCKVVVQQRESKVMLFWGLEGPFLAEFKVITRISQVLKVRALFLQVGYRISPVIAELHSGFFECQASYMGRSDSYTIDVTVRPKTSFVPPPHINR